MGELIPFPPGEPATVPVNVKVAFEDKLVASLLAEVPKVQRLPAFLAPEHFAGGTPRRIFAAIKALESRGEAVSIAAVGEELSRAKQLVAISYGGSTGLDALRALSIEYAEEPLPWLARKVRALWAEREEHDARAKAAARLRQGEDPDRVAEDLNATLAALNVVDDPDAGLTILDTEQIFAELPPPAYLVEPVVQRGSVSLLGSFGGSGKTWLALALMAAIATGRPWLGRFNTKPGRALLVDFESGEYEIRRRVQKIVKGLGASEASGIRLCTFPRLFMSDRDFEARISRLASAHDLIVIDSLRACARGVDENDSRVRDGLDILQRVAKATGCAFLVITHAKKSSGTVGQIDERELLRGSSAIYDAADSVFVVAFAKGRPLRLVQTKARLGVQIEDIEVTMSDTPQGGGIWITAQDAEQKATREDDPLERTMRDVLSAVRAHPDLGNRELRGAVKGRGSSVDLAINELLKAGRIRNLGDEKKASYRVA